MNLGGWVYLELCEPIAVEPTLIELSCQTVEVLTAVTIEVKLYHEPNY
jgi:hypothetical protein